MAARARDSKHHPQDDWVVVETISDGGMTVVSIGGRQAEWSTVERRAPNYVPIRRFLAEVQSAQEPADRTFTSPQGGRSTRVVALPIPTPRGLCHGVQFWCGPVDSEPPPPRSIAGCIWDFERQICIQPYESTVMSGREDVFTEEVTLARILSLGSRYDDQAPVLQELFAPEPGHRSQTFATIPHTDGHLMRWQVNLIAHEPGIFCIWEDVTDARPVAPPTLSQIGLESTGHHGLNVAVIAPHVGTLAMFVTPAPDWIQYNYRRAGVSIFQPDDLPKLVEFVDSDTFDSAPAGQQMRLHILNVDDEYEPVDMTLQPYPDALGTALVVASFKRGIDD